MNNAEKQSLKAAAINNMIDAINEDAGYEYINDRENQESVVTNDTIDDFKRHQTHCETIETSKGILEVFALAGSRELTVMDFGDFRVAML